MRRIADPFIKVKEMEGALIKRPLKKSLIYWSGRVPNPSNGEIYNFNFLTISFRIISLFRELDITA
ncbi:MAG: hypothetical protein ACUVTN_09955 [Thermodesulfobacteriota bacterium]